MIGKSTKGRWTGSQPQVQEIPKFDYAALELRVAAQWEHVMVVFPGKDGFGPDFYTIKDRAKKKKGKFK